MSSRASEKVSRDGEPAMKNGVEESGEPAMKEGVEGTESRQ